MGAAHELTTEIQGLIFESQRNGWKVQNMRERVSCWVFVGQSLRRALGLIRIEGPAG